MNRIDFTDSISSLFNEILELNRSKGKDYSGDEDALANFKINAEKLGTTPLMIWAVYANKHLDAINSFVKNGGQVESEPIKERIKDAILYLFLLHGLINDNSENLLIVKYPYYDSAMERLWFNKDTWVTQEEIDRQCTYHKHGEDWEPTVRFSESVFNKKDREAMTTIAKKHDGTMEESGGSDNFKYVTLNEGEWELTKGRKWVKINASTKS